MDNSSIMVERSGGLFYGWVIVSACLLIAIITYGVGLSFGVFLTPFREAFSCTSAAASGAYSAAMFAYTGFGVIAGWGVDKYGPKIITILGGLLLGFGLLLTSQVNTNHIWQLYMTYGLLGMGMSPAWATLMTTASKWFVKRRGLALGIISTGVGIGPLIMAPLASYLVYTSGWRFTFLVLSPTAGLIIAAATLLKRSPEEIGRLPNSEIDNAVMPQPERRVNKDTSEFNGLSLREAINTKAFWLLSSMNLMVGIGIVMIMAHIVAYSESQGIPPISAAIVLSTLTGTSIVGRLIMGMASDWIGRKRVFVICVSIEGIILLCMISASNTWMLFLFAAIFGFCYGGHSPQFPALTAEFLGLRYMGTMLGATAFFWGIGGAIGPVLAGHMIDITGSYAGAFILGAATMFLGAIGCLLLKPESRVKPGQRGRLS